MDARLKIIEVWSDYVCPFCYLEKPVLERIVEDYQGKVAVNWRAFELRPDPIPTLDPKGDYLQRAWKNAVYPMARQRGMELQLPPVQPRSRLALEAAEFARESGKYSALHQAIFAAFFERGLDIGQMEVLMELGRQTGLDTASLKEGLRTGKYTNKVLADQALAHQLNISGVPALLIHSTNQPLETGILLSGAQPYDLIKMAIERELNATENIA